MHIDPIKLHLNTAEQLVYNKDDLSLNKVKKSH